MQRRGLGAFAQGIQNQAGQQGYAQQQAPPPPPPQGSQQRAVPATPGYAPTSYAPTTYDSANVHGVPPEQFYGSYVLTPSPISRVTDCVFVQQTARSIWQAVRGVLSHGRRCVLRHRPTVPSRRASQYGRHRAHQIHLVLHEAWCRPAGCELLSQISLLRWYSFLLSLNL